jgi:hypothetical protein
VGYYSDWCVVASNYDEFERGIAKVIAEGSPESRRRHSDAMRSETWEEKVTQLGARVMCVQHQSGSSKPVSGRQSSRHATVKQGI